MSITEGSVDVTGISVTKDSVSSIISGHEVLNYSHASMSDGILRTPYNNNNDDPLLSTGVIDGNLMGHQCTCNYDGSLCAMELAGLLLTMIEMEAKYEGQIYLDYVVTNNNAKMKIFISHAKYRPRG